MGRSQAGKMMLDEDAGPLSAGQRKYLGIIQENTGRILQTTSRLLDVTRIEEGRAGPVLQPVNLSGLVREVVVFEPEVAARTQHLTLGQVPVLPPARCNATRAMQIIRNGLSNAVKYTPLEGHIRIDVDFAGEKGFLQVSVADDGIGIGREDQSKLFRRFFRAASALEVGVSGVGLGLHITRALVELHGGLLWLESGLGHGSTFCATFRIADRSEAHRPNGREGLLVYSLSGHWN
jgi:two-component system sensor histidine kinase BarA